jgi:hypothetical protein
VWTDAGNPVLSAVSAVSLHEDTALITGGVPGRHRHRLAVVSLLDGQVGWQLDEDMALPGGADDTMIASRSARTASPSTG